MWLKRNMARIGYPPPMVDVMSLADCAAMLGDKDHDPVILGGRGLSLKSDAPADAPPGLLGPGGKPMSSPQELKRRLDAKMVERIKAAKSQGSTGATPSIGGDALPS